ncbi:MAG TPA: hypothetical protein VN436_08190 [Holophaga sp.]|nr:hypothetical protein [Holophaga sp.]
MIRETLLVLAIAAATFAQQPPPPPGGGGNGGPMAYDASAERTLQGSVTSLDIQSRGPGRMVTLAFLADGTTWKVLAGPEDLLKKQGLGLAAGDSLTIVGCAVKGPEGQMFIARQISKGGTTVTLLDASGRPAGGPGGPGTGGNGGQPGPPSQEGQSW